LITKTLQRYASTSLIAARSALVVSLAHAHNTNAKSLLL
jgi:hypothetical protein